VALRINDVWIGIPSGQELTLKAALVNEFGTLSIVRLGKADWRISSGSNPDVLLGYIERQRSGRFEVTWMTDPMRWGYAASFDEALLAFGESVRFTGEILDQRAPVVGVQREPVFHAARRTTWLKPNGRSSVA
jgi:hypothetical protein